jgi:hypothetical protein
MLGFTVLGVWAKSRRLHLRSRFQRDPCIRGDRSFPAKHLTHHTLSDNPRDHPVHSTASRECSYYQDTPSIEPADEIPQFLLRCGGSNISYYCNRSCQKDDWPDHKAQCKDPEWRAANKRYGDAIAKEATRRREERDKVQNAIVEITGETRFAFNERLALQEPHDATWKHSKDVRRSARANQSSTDIRCSEMIKSCGLTTVMPISERLHQGSYRSSLRQKSVSQSKPSVPAHMSLCECIVSPMSAC